MTEQCRKEAIEYIESQLKHGYVDLGSFEQDELEIIQEALNILKMVDKFNSSGCTSFTIIPTQEKSIKVAFEGEPAIKIIDHDLIEVKEKLYGTKAEKVISDIFGTTDIAAYDCNEMTDEEINNILN